MTVANAAGIVLVKEMEYRGDLTEEWSNRYWFTGTIPTLASEWKTLAESLMGYEATCYAATSKIIRAYGYNDTNPDTAYAVWTYDYKLNNQSYPGTLVVDGDRFPGDVAGLCAWQTSRRNARGRWVWLRKYFHDGCLDNSDPDQIGASTKAAYAAFVLRMANGTFVDGRILRSGVQDEVIQAAHASNWATTRSLKRRGKRPKPAATSSAAARVYAEMDVPFGGNSLSISDST